jgi:hypothetical protein
MIAVTNHRYWGEVLASLFARRGIAYEFVSLRPNWYFIGWLLCGRWRRYTAFHVVGMCWWLVATMRFFRPVVCHWIGSDVLAYRTAKERTIRGWLHRKAAECWIRYNLADSPELATELAHFGIKARVVRLLPEMIEADIEPLPAKFTVLSYWGAAGPDFYGAKVLLRLAEEFPAFRFIVVGTRGVAGNGPPNIEYFGPVPDLRHIYRQSSVLIRMPIHDSVSAMVLEMLARGRYAIYNKRIDGCHYAEDLDQARAALHEISAMKEPNYMGAKEVRRNFSLDKVQPGNAPHYVSGVNN